MMTNCAFQFWKFKLDECFSSFRDLFVTTCTSYLGVLAIQFKGGFIVVESLNFPVGKSVTFRTIGTSDHGKLFVVRLLMAFFALVR